MSERNNRTRPGRASIGRALDLTRVRRNSAVDGVADLYVQEPLVIADGRVTLNYDPKTLKVTNQGQLRVSIEEEPSDQINAISPTTTKGDMLVDDGALSPDSSLQRHPLTGDDGFVLQKDSGTSLGVKWALDPTTASNVGTGENIFQSQVDTDLRFKRIKAASSKVTVVTNPGGDTIEVDASAGAIMPCTTKGDIIGFGTSHVRIPVGATTYMPLTVLSSDAEGIAWGLDVAADRHHPGIDGDGIRYPVSASIPVGSVRAARLKDGAFFGKRYLEVYVDPNSVTTPQTVGTPAPTFAGTVSLSTEKYPWLVHVANAGLSAGIISPNFNIVTSGFRYIWEALIHTHSNITSTRYWVGCVDTNPDAITTPVTNFAAFRYDTSVSDTVWQCVTANTTPASTVTSSGITVAADTDYMLRIEADANVDPGSVYFYINDVLVVTHIGSSHNIAASNAYLGYAIRVTHLGASGNRRIWWTRVAIRLN